MPRPLPSRRDLIAAAALLAIPAARATPGHRIAALPGCGILAGLCAELNCPESIRRACLRALPAGEAAPARLAAALLGGPAPAGADRTAAAALRHRVRELSRQDFASGRIAQVDGWMLSLTETRLYALSALLAAGPPGEPSAAPAGS